MRRSGPNPPGQQKAVAAPALHAHTGHRSKKHTVCPTKLSLQLWRNSYAPVQLHALLQRPVRTPGPLSLLLLQCRASRRVPSYSPACAVLLPLPGELLKQLLLPLRMLAAELRDRSIRHALL